MTDARVRVTHVLRRRLRRLDEARLLYVDAVYTRIGQAAVKMFIAAAVLLVILMASIAIVWSS